MRWKREMGNEKNGDEMVEIVEIWSWYVDGKNGDDEIN